MKKEFFDFVWKVIDKFGYPVLGAFILSIVTLVIAPDKYVEMVPFPDNKIYWACAILVVLYTLIFALLRYVWSEFRKKRFWNSHKEATIKKEEKEAMQALWNAVDAFSESDRTDIKKFLETDNKPVAKYGRYFSYDSLYNSNWVISIEKHTTEDYIDTNIETGKKEVFTRVSTHMYKLNPEIYQALKYSMTAYGKISNFDE